MTKTADARKVLRHAAGHRVAMNVDFKLSSGIGGTAPIGTRVPIEALKKVESRHAN